MKKEISLVKRTTQELGITQKELAERIGVSERTMSTWAKGNFEPHIGVMLKALMNERKYFALIEDISILQRKSLDKIENISI